MYQHEKSYKLYRDMCGTNGFDFKESIGSILDLGDAERKILQNLGKTFSLSVPAVHGIQLNEYNIIRGE